MEAFGACFEARLFSLTRESSYTTPEADNDNEIFVCTMSLVRTFQLLMRPGVAISCHCIYAVPRFDEPGETSSPL